MGQHPVAFKYDVMAVLAAVNPVAANYFNLMFNHQPREIYNRNQELQDVNRFWRTQLSLLGPHTQRARMSLIDNISTTSWMELFNRDLVMIICNEWVNKVSQQ